MEKNIGNCNKMKVLLLQSSNTPRSGILRHTIASPVVNRALQCEILCFEVITCVPINSVTICCVGCTSYHVYIDLCLTVEQYVYYCSLDRSWGEIPFMRFGYGDSLKRAVLSPGRMNLGRAPAEYL